MQTRMVEVERRIAIEAGGRKEASKKTKSVEVGRQLTIVDAPQGPKTEQGWAVDEFSLTLFYSGRFSGVLVDSVCLTRRWLFNG